MEIRIIKNTNSVDIRNEAFEIFGKLIPSFDGKKWKCTEEIWPSSKVTEMCFPEERYNPMESDSIFLGAFNEDECIGLAVLEDSRFKHMYISDLKVASDYRRMGIGRRLVDKALDIAKSNGYRGLSVIAQDNNLGACRFYLKTGFEIGGFDNRVYSGTKQEGKADIIFYREDAVTYRMATANDASVLVKIYNAAFKSDYDKFGECPMYGLSDEQMIASIERNPKRIIMWGSEPVGILSYSHEGRGVYDISCLAVDPEYQRMGIASQALNYMISLCDDWEKITTITPIEDKDKIKFYIEQNGFDVVGREMEGNVEVAKLERRRVHKVDYDEYEKDMPASRTTTSTVSSVTSVEAVDSEESVSEVKETSGALYGSLEAGNTSAGALYGSLEAGNTSAGALYGSLEAGANADLYGSMTTGSYYGDEDKESPEEIQAKIDEANEKEKELQAELAKLQASIEASLANSDNAEAINSYYMSGVEATTNNAGEDDDKYEYESLY